MSKALKKKKAPSASKPSTKSIDWATQTPAQRKKAAWRFCKSLDGPDNKAARKACTGKGTAASNAAYAALRTAGPYTNMPKKEDLPIRIVAPETLTQQDGPMVLMIL